MTRNHYDFGWYPSKGHTYTITGENGHRSGVRVDKVSTRHKTVNITLLDTAVGEVQAVITFDQATYMKWESLFIKSPFD